MLAFTVNDTKSFMNLLLKGDTFDTFHFRQGELSTFRTGEVYQDKIKPVLHESKFIQWDDGKLIISFK